MDADKLSILSVAVLMDNPCHHTLARPGFTGEQDGASGWRHGPDLTEDFPHCRIVSLNDFQAVRSPKAIPQIVQFGLEDDRFVDTFRYILHFLRADRITQVVAGSCLDGHHSLSDHFLRTHDYHFNRGVQVPKWLQRGCIAVVRHRFSEDRQIHKDQIVALFHQTIQSGIFIPYRIDSALGIKTGMKRPANLLFFGNNEKVPHLHLQIDTSSAPVWFIQ